MSQPDLKKLITGFLVLAVIATTGSLILSRFLPTNANTKPQTAALSLKNAFLPDGGLNLDASGIVGYQNLTQNLAGNLAQSLIQNNLSGPNATGTAGIKVPDGIEDVVSKYIDSSNIDPAKIPSPRVEEKRLRIVKGSSKEDVSSYFTSLQTIFSAFDSQEFKSLNTQAKNGSGELLMDSFLLFYSDIETKLYDVTIPEPFLQYHKDLIILIDAAKIIFGQNIESDPLQSELVLSNAQSVFEATHLDALKEAEILKLTLPKFSDSSRNKLVSYLIPEAQAVIPVIDWLNFPQNYLAQVASWLSEYFDAESWYGTILTEKLKDKLLKAVVNAILNWANGGSSGASPSFVTNWGEFLKNSYVNAADNAIANVTSGLCEPFRNQIQLQLYSLYGESSVRSVLRRPTLNDLRTCSLQQTVSNLDDFYGNFGQGGWAGYLALTDFGGNPYGSLYLASQQVGKTAQQQQEADKAKAASGYVGTERCADGSDPVTAGLCSDGSAPEITTPGTNIAQSTSDSITSAIHRIVNAQDWKALAVQLASFAITKITSSGNKGIRYSGATGEQPADKYASCSGYKLGSNDYLSCIQNIDEANGTGDGHGSKDLLLTQAKQALTDAGSALETIKLSIDAASSSIAILQSVASSSSQCPSEAITAQNELLSLNQEYADLLAKEDNLISQISALTTFVSEVQDHDSQDQNFFLAKLDEFRNTFGGPGFFAQMRGDAQAEAQNLQEKLQQSSDLLKACFAH